MEILVPICICVVLPIAVVLIPYLTRINADNKRAKVIIKAIESNKDVDTDRLVESLKKPQKTPAELFNARLLRGCIYSLIGLFLVTIGIIAFDDDPVLAPCLFGGISLAVGISYLIVCIVSRKYEKTSDK